MRGSVPESVSARTVIAVASMAPASPDDPPRQSDEQVGAQCCECYVLHDLHGKGVRQAMARSAVSARARCAEQRAGHLLSIHHSQQSGQQFAPLAFLAPSCSLVAFSALISIFPSTLGRGSRTVPPGASP